MPRYEIKVRTNARKEGISEGPGETLVVSVNAPPVEGKANSRLIELLATRFKVSKHRVRIIRGKSSSRKLVEIS